MSVLFSWLYFACLLQFYNLANVHAGFCDLVENEKNSLCISPDPDCLAYSIPCHGLIDASVQEHIFSFHNEQRERVARGQESLGQLGPQPGTKCMAQLSWDDQLAKAAQNWADQCTLYNDTSRDLDPSNPIAAANRSDIGVGQNIYGYIDGADVLYRPRSLPDNNYWDEAMNNWYGEVKDFDKVTVASYKRNTATDHYTQFIWGRTTKIGCGFRRWEMDDDSGRFARVFVCNYWPKGNVIGAPVYTSAKSKAVCAKGCDIYPSKTFQTTKLFGALCETTSSPVPALPIPILTTASIPEELIIAPAPTPPNDYWSYSKTFASPMTTRRPFFRYTTTTSMP